MEDSVFPSNYSWAARISWDWGNSAPLLVRPGYYTMIHISYPISGKVSGVTGMGLTPPASICPERHSQGKPHPRNSGKGTMNLWGLVYRFPHLWAGASCFNHQANTRGDSLGAESRLPGSVFDADLASPLACGPLRRGTTREGSIHAGPPYLPAWSPVTGVPVNRRHSPRPGRTYPYRLHLGESERTVGLDGKPNFYWAYLKARQILQNAGPGYKPG